MIAAGLLCTQHDAAAAIIELSRRRLCHRRIAGESDRRPKVIKPICTAVNVGVDKEALDAFDAE